MSNDLSIYDIMGQDMEVAAFKNKQNNEIRVQIYDENGKCVYDEESHPFAWDSLVLFARQVMYYEKWFKDLERIIEEVEEDEEKVRKRTSQSPGHPY